MLNWAARFLGTLSVSMLLQVATPTHAGPFEAVQPGRWIEVPNPVYPQGARWHGNTGMRIDVAAPATMPSDAASGSADSSAVGTIQGWLIGSLAIFLLLAACSAARNARHAMSLAAIAGSAALLGAHTAHAGGLPSLVVVSHSPGAQSNVPVSFGQIFKPGDVPSGSTVAATTASGSPLTLQIDGKATHADGSLRHAVITVLVPNIAANGSQVVQLVNAGSASSGTAVALSDLLATSFDAQVQLNVGGTVYIASARQFLQNAAPEAWLSGPLVSEWIVGGPVKTAGGAAHPHLAAYFHVRAYAGNPINRVRVDVVIENGWTFVTGPTTFDYTANVAVGTNTYSGAITHYHHTRWHKRFWWGSDPMTYAKHDTMYLQNTGAVPRYMSLQPTEAYLSSLAQASVPMGHGDLTQYFPTTGAQNSIGPLPRWTTAYVLSADERAFKNMLANDDSAGSYSMHYRDEHTGKPVSIADYPNICDNFSQAEGGGLPDSSGTNPNTADAAHQPSIAFVSYLETGDYFYLEELQFWTSWNHLDANPLPPYGYRQGSKGIFKGQVRGQAWSLRNLGQAAYATPDSHRYKAELVSSVGYNLTNGESLYPDNPSANKLGALISLDGYQAFAPWMDDFYTWSVGYLGDLGFNATKMRNWKAQFPVGVMGTTDYCYIHAAAYHLTVGTSDTVWWPDFATLYAQNFGANTSCPLGGPMIGYPDQPDGYTSNLRPALAVAVDAGLSGASAAWDRFITSAPQPDYTDYANWAVIPRSISGSGVSLTLSANPNPVASGQSATLTWITLGVTSCTAGDGWSGTKGPSGSATVGPLSAAATYKLSCVGSGGTVERSVTVNVGTSTPPASSAPTVTLAANPTSIASNGMSTLTWSSTNATSCSASGGWSGTQSVSGTKGVGPLTASTTYELTCTGPGGTVPASTTVSVADSAPAAPGTAAAGSGTSTQGDSSGSSGSGGGGGAMGTPSALFLFLMCVMRVWPPRTWRLRE